MAVATIHPFPARMAPEIAQRELGTLEPGSRVIDPMCGSGTVLRAAVERGHDCIGYDLDPLAVMMSQVWCSPPDAFRLVHDARDVVVASRELSKRDIAPFPDTATAEFISYWFAPEQRDALSRIATVLRASSSSTAAALAISMSRVIVTKEMSASLARDTSHSRPHRVADTNDFDVCAGFLKAARLVAKRIRKEEVQGKATVVHGDARSLDGLPDSSFDLALTSPPYLNAIDYLRGHRLTLVWLGYDVGGLRGLRSRSVGAERSREPVRGQESFDTSPFVVRTADSTFSEKHAGWVDRYADDMGQVVRELARVIRPGGSVVLVIGNCTIRGAQVDNAGILQALGEEAGLTLAERAERSIPARRRYLPPPVDAGGGTLDTRMRTETVLTMTA